MSTPSRLNTIHKIISKEQQLKSIKIKKKLKKNTTTFATTTFTKNDLTHKQAKNTTRVANSLQHVILTALPACTFC